MSILIKNQAIFKIIICVGVAILTISCKEVDPYADTEEYTYMPLTPELIDELGGVDSLHRYQFYLSDSFELHRVDNEKSYAGQGIVNNVDNNYSVVFDKLTPGIFHGSDVIEGRNYSDPDVRIIRILFEHSLYAYLDFAYLNDKDTYDRRYYHVKGYVREKTFQPKFSNNYYGVNMRVFEESYHSMVKDKSSKKYYLDGDSDIFYTYKNYFWNKKMIYSKEDVKKMKHRHNDMDETYLIIRIKNISKSTTEYAKGVVLPESL